MGPCLPPWGKGVLLTAVARLTSRAPCCPAGRRGLSPLFPPLQRDPCPGLEGFSRRRTATETRRPTHYPTGWPVNWTSTNHRHRPMPPVLACPSPLPPTRGLPDPIPLVSAATAARPAPGQQKIRCSTACGLRSAGCVLTVFSLRAAAAYDRHVPRPWSVAAAAVAYLYCCRSGSLPHARTLPSVARPRKALFLTTRCGSLLCSAARPCCIVFCCCFFCLLAIFDHLRLLAASRRSLFSHYSVFTSAG